MISRRTRSVSKEDVFSSGLLYSDSRCSQACRRHSHACRRRSQVLHGAPEGHCVGPVNSGIWPPCNSGATTLRHSQWHNYILLMWCSLIPVGTPSPGFALLNFILHHHLHSPWPPHTTSRTPPFQVVHLFFPEFIILSFKLHFDWPPANLNSNPFGYHKLSQTTLEFTYTHSPVPDHLIIYGAPLASLRRWWNACSCLCRPWWNGRFDG